MCQFAGLLSVVGNYGRAETILRKALASAAAAGVPPVHKVEEWINLATIRSHRLDRDGALSASGEALRLLAEDAPQSGLQENDRRALLAVALSNHALFLQEAERLAGQVEAGLEAVARARDLISPLTDWAPARKTLIGAQVARARLLVLSERYAEALGCAEGALAEMAAGGDEFWRGPALNSRAMALTALQAEGAPDAAEQALAFHRSALDAGKVEDVHGYCDAAAVAIDLAATAGTLTDARVSELLSPLPDWFQRLGPERGGFVAAELVRAVEEHCGGIAAWPAFHKRG